MRGKFTGDKVTLWARLAIVVADLIALVFIIAAVSLQPQFFNDFGGPAIDGMQLAPIGWSLIWTSASLLLNFRGVTYPPGVDIAMELFCWGLNIGMIWLLILMMVLYHPYSTQCYDDSCTLVAARALEVSEIIASMMMIFSCMVHILLFIKACYAVDKQRKARKLARNSFVELDEHVGPAKT